MRHEGYIYQAKYPLIGETLGYFRQIAQSKTCLRQIDIKINRIENADILWVPP